MGSFQQIIMGSTCLAAAFFFGSYLHNRPADDQTAQRSVVSADPMESLLGFGQRPASKPQPASLQQVPLQNQTAAIDPSELAPVLVSNTMPRQQEMSSAQEIALPRKPVVPDFSDLASRFRNTPLELTGTVSENANPSESAIHASERVHYSGTFKAPEMVIRQPQALRPLQDFRDAIDRVENRVEKTVPASVTEVEPTSGRWRTSQPERFESFQPAPKPVTPPQFVNRQPRQPRETIEDVVSQHSADWLKEADASQFRRDDNSAQRQQTFATNPPQSQGWNSLQQRKVTEQAAQRHHDLLEIEDPGNRFRSMQNDVAYAAPPEPDYSTYYKPSTDRRDVREESGNRGRASSQFKTIKNDRGPQDWGRQSNVDSRYEIKTGDTLQSISTRFYGTPDRYLDIYRANRDVLDRITSSPVGVMIEIPNAGN